MPFVIPFRMPKLGKYFTILLPLLEIAVFIIVGGLIGVLPTILLIIATTMLGFYVLRVQGTLAVWRMDQHLKQQSSPTDMMGASLQVMAGLLLIIPGFITDSLGLLLLISPLRQFCVKWLFGHNMVRKPGNGDVLEGEYWQNNGKQASEHNSEQLNKPSSDKSEHS